MADAGEGHRHVAFVGGGNRVFVAHRSARLNHRRRAGLSGGDESVAARAASLRAYPPTVRLGFPKERWVTLCDEIRAGDNSPIYRDEQRAFHDAVRDILVPELGYKPVVRVFENDITRETESANRSGQNIGASA
jgi:hypothetical protein